MVELCCDGFVISIELVNPQTRWLRLYLPENGMRLGSGVAEYVIGRLSELIDASGDYPPWKTWNVLGCPDSWELEGYSVRWILSLSEHHCSLYAAQTDCGWRVFWQNANAAVIARGSLSREQGERWITELKTLL